MAKITRGTITTEAGEPLSMSGMHRKDWSPTPEMLARLGYNEIVKGSMQGELWTRLVHGEILIPPCFLYSHDAGIQRLYNKSRFNSFCNMIKRAERFFKIKRFVLEIDNIPFVAWEVDIKKTIKSMPTGEL